MTSAMSRVTTRATTLSRNICHSQEVLPLWQRGVRGDFLKLMRPVRSQAMGVL